MRKFLLSVAIVLLWAVVSPAQEAGSESNFQQDAWARIPESDAARVEALAQEYKDFLRRARHELLAVAEAERLAKEKSVVGFFISGHPLGKFRDEVSLFSTRTTATLGTWSEHTVSIGAVVTALNRRISRKTGAEYARLTLEDFHGTAEAIVFPEAWSKLSSAIVTDAALLLSGGYSARDRGEDRAPFIVEEVTSLANLRQSGAVGVSLRWESGNGPDPKVAQAIAALCASYPGPAAVTVEWRDGNGTTAHMQSRRLRVELDEEFLVALRELVGKDRVTLVKVR